MTRFSTTFFVAALAASLLQANAAPLQLHARAEDVTPNFTQDSQCANSEIVASLLSSALAVLDQAKAKDNAVANDLATLKGFLTAASLIENSTVGSCNGTADASNGTAGEGSNNNNATDSSADNNNDAGSNSTNADTGNDAKNNGTSEEGSDGKDTGSSQGKGSGASSSQKSVVASLISSARAAQKTQGSKVRFGRR